MKNLLLITTLLIFTSCDRLDHEFEQSLGSSSRSESYRWSGSLYCATNPSFVAENFLKAAKRSQVDELRLSVVVGAVFGLDYENLRQILSSQKVSKMILYLSWAGCLRDEDCQPGTVLEFLDVEHHQALIDRREGWLFERYRTALGELIPLIESFPEVHWIIFPELESNLKQIDHLQVIQSLDPLVLGLQGSGARVELGYNPHSPLLLEGEQTHILEFHRFASQGLQCIANNDGISVNLFGESFDSGEGESWSVFQVKEYFKFSGCEENYVWHHRLSNCFSEEVAPRDRDCSGNSVADFEVYLDSFKEKIVDE